MDIETFRLYCLSKKGVSESFPFDDNTLVFKVMEKIFALTGLDGDIFRVNLKCDPEKAVELRDEYEEVQPGYHMNKRHWNSIDFGGDVNDTTLKSWIDHSYDLVVKGLRKSDKEALKLS
jgi:predicted DNA-binding protein (MmcQ/YjbR family)